jgi:hypothetical protein
MKHGKYPQILQIHSDEFAQNKSAKIRAICGQKFFDHVWTRINTLFFWEGRRAAVPEIWVADTATLLNLFLSVCIRVNPWLKTGSILI